MKITTESVLVVTTEKGEVVAIVRKDIKLQKNLMYRVTDAKMSDIESLLNGGIENLLNGNVEENLIPAAALG